MNRSKKKVSPVEEKPSEIKYSFSKLFDAKFDALIKAYSDALASLTKMSSGKIDCDYGVCATSYHTRYITPKNISTFVDNLLRVIEEGFFHDNMNDVNMFIVASVRKFFEENECEVLDDDATRSEARDNVNPKEWTLNDLEMICANNAGSVAVYSKGEMIQRIKLATEDINKMKTMHFAANAKKLVSALPKIINDTCIYSMAIMKAIFTAIEDFILFATTVNTCTVLQMYAYCNPATDYSFKKEKKEDSDEEDVITECCMCKSNDYMIRNRIPFNCNMRDIILQDVTPDFKDTHDALHFIMKDSRSPISILVTKYAPKDAGRNFHGGDAIARMFLGVNRCHEHCLDDVFKKDGDRVADPLEDVAGFQTKVDWLDTIAFGNNYLDGNYRRDAVGNNHVHPITNSLDMIFKMYGGIDLKTNEEIAGNIINVVGAIRGIIHVYNAGAPIENYDLTKDVLVLLGEILTRNMLRLYYNNTQVTVFRDDMQNAAAPGFIEEAFMMESFVEGEDDEEYVMEATDGTGSDTGDKKKEGNYAGMKYTDANGKEIKPTDPGKIRKLLDAIIKWFKNIWEKWTGTATKNLLKYSEEVSKNDSLNKDIAAAIGSSFKIHHPKFHKFNIDLNKFKRDEGVLDYVNQCIGAGSDTGLAYDFNKMVIRMLGVPEEKVDNIITAENSPGKGADGKDQTNWKDISTKTVIYFFYNGFADEERFATGDITPDMWNDVCNDVKNAPEVLKQAADAFEKKGDAISQALKKAIEGTDVKDAVKKRVEDLTNAYKKAYTELSKTIVTSLATTWAKDRYSMWADIKSKYKTMGGNNTTTTTTEGGENNA